MIDEIIKGRLAKWTNRYKSKPKPFTEHSIVFPQVNQFCRIPNVFLKDELLTRINDVLRR